MRRALNRRYGRAFGQKPAATTPEFEAALAAFLTSAQAKIDANLAEVFAGSRATLGDPTFGGKMLSLERGPKYIRVVVSDNGTACRAAKGVFGCASQRVLVASSWLAFNSSTVVDGPVLNRIPL